MFLSGKIVKSAKKDLIACVVMMLGCIAHIVLWLAAGKGEISGCLPVLFGLAAVYVVKLVVAVNAKKNAYEYARLGGVKTGALVSLILSLVAVGGIALAFIMALQKMFDEYSTAEIFVTFASVVAAVSFSLLDLVMIVSIRKDSAEVLKSGSLDPWKEVNKDNKENTQVI